MDGKSTSSSLSDTTSKTEPVTDEGTAHEVIIKLEEFKDHLGSEESTEIARVEMINEAKIAWISAPIVSIEPSTCESDSKSNNEDEKIVKSISGTPSSKDDSARGDNIETTYPNESCVDAQPTERSCDTERSLKREFKDEENRAVAMEDIAAGEEKVNVEWDKTGVDIPSPNVVMMKLEISVDSDSGNIAQNDENKEQDDGAKMGEWNNGDNSNTVGAMKSCEVSDVVEESLGEIVSKEVSVDRSLVPAQTIDELSKSVEDNVKMARTTEIIEFVEYTSVDKTDETIAKNSEVIEIVMESNDEEIENGLEIVQLKTTTTKTTSYETENDNEVAPCFEDTKDTEKLRNEVRSDKPIKNGESVSSEVNIASMLPEVPTEKTKDSTISSTSSQIALKQRSVIEDIFDDWQDENPEDDSSQQLAKSHDSVEMELKILLDDEKSTDKPREKNIRSIAPNEVEQKIAEKSEGERPTVVSKERTAIGKQVPKECQKSKKEIGPIKESTEPRKVNKVSEITPIGRERPIKQKPLAPRPGVKVPGILLTSPIVSKSAVSKVLKERIREQQKEFDSPTKPDIFFVKKITQRLSHKLAAASAAQVPGLLPLPQISKSATASETKKTTTSGVDKELLAILEGDVDPDWSNLKGPNLAEEAKSTTLERNAPAKLDPLIEREIALKQLLELPSSPAKKNTIKKSPAKPSGKKTTKVIELKGTSPRSNAKIDDDHEVETSRPDTTNIEAVTKDDSVDSSESLQEPKFDETRSGRKRKPTEKAREHEFTTKRLKVFKGKASGNKAKSQQMENSLVADQTIARKSDPIDTSETEVSPDNTEITTLNEAARKRVNDSTIVKVDSSSEGTRTEHAAKKISVKPNAKRKVPGAPKLMRQKITPNKKSSMGLKVKFPKGIAKKTGNKLTGTSSKGPKQRNGDSTHVEAIKPKKKSINEIDKLLQDEGVVNLLYDVEQPDTKRLVPITKSQTKVMDLQKIQRELKIRTKLVRNAVLRLRTSNITTNKVSPRSKRSISHVTDSHAEKRPSEKKIVPSTSPVDFIYPAKIRNAADASIIIRRHSSSSFSSTSASPRASIDAPDRSSVDGARSDDTASHVLRSNKRRKSQENEDKKTKSRQSLEPKRNRRRITDRSESETKSIEEESSPVLNAATKGKSTVIATISPVATPTSSLVKAKKIDGRKNQKSLKQQNQQSEQVIEVDENNGVGKIATRSNAATTGGGKVMPKSKKPVKCKVTFAKGSESFNKKMESPGQQDELSACLAEAVTALSNDSGGSSRTRSNIPVSRNKTKGHSSVTAKSFDSDEKQSKTEPRVQFSNNEIIVRRHGKLVQLLMTPSTTTNIRNGITLQVMQEIRENLSILKKDEDCRVVLLTSTGTSFCEGLELSTLLHENKEERRLRAEELANAVKEFIKSLATFNKPIVAGVQGTAIGLGVTMLPWFDLVIASDKATFSTPYGKLGQIAEGAAIFTLSHILGSAVTSELLLGGRTLTANEALRAGLVTRVLWPDRFQDELLPSLRAMSEQSSQSMEATKALLRHSLRKKLDAALESESYLLVQHWCSAECQAAITAYVDDKFQ